jgi:hypothetical protein
MGTITTLAKMGDILQDKMAPIIRDKMAPITKTLIQEKTTTFFLDRRPLTWQVNKILCGKSAIINF